MTCRQIRTMERLDTGKSENEYKLVIWLKIFLSSIYRDFAHPFKLIMFFFIHQVRLVQLFFEAHKATK